MYKLSYDEIADFQNTLIRDWGEDGKRVIEAIQAAHKTPMPLINFLRLHCLACGGDIGGMYLTGIHKLYPEVWDAIPNQMGVFAFTDLCCVLALLQIDCSGEPS